MFKSGIQNKNLPWGSPLERAFSFYTNQKQFYLGRGDRNFI